MKIFLQLVLSAGLICFLSAASPVLAQTLSTDKAPAIPSIPARLPADQNAALKKQLAGLAPLRDTFSAALDDYNKTPRTGIVVGSSQEANLNNKISAVNRARAAYIFEAKKFIKAVTDALAAQRLRFIKLMNAYIHTLGWSPEKQARADAALNKLGFDGDPVATSTIIRDAWTNILARDSDTDLAAEAAQGDGPGFPGAGTQSHEDCAVFALANATGRPYGFVAASATDLIRHAEWRPADERNAPEQTFSRSGLNGGEVIILAEIFGQATVISSHDFPKTLQAGHRILIAVVPSDGDVNSGHEIVLSKTFKHGGETWFAVMDSNQSPDKLLYLNSRELDIILQQNGVMFQPEPLRTPVLLRDRKD